MSVLAPPAPGIEFLATQEGDRAFLMQLAGVADVFHRMFFGGRLAVKVEISDLAGDILGMYKWGTVHLSRAMIAGRADVQRGGTGDADGIFRLAADTLLHEMVHGFQGQVLERITYCAPLGGHDAGFLAICRMIMPHLRGLAPLAGKHLTLETCPQWPMSFKHAAFYRGVAPRLKRFE